MGSPVAFTFDLEWPWKVTQGQKCRIWSKIDTCIVRYFVRANPDFNWFSLHKWVFDLRTSRAYLRISGKDVGISRPLGVCMNFKTCIQIHSTRKKLRQWAETSLANKFGYPDYTSICRICTDLLPLWLKMWPWLDFGLWLETKSNGAIEFSICFLLHVFMSNGNVWPNASPLRDTIIQSLNDLDLSRSLNCDGAIGLYIHGFLLAFNSNIWPNSALFLR